ncbi:MAG TPA: UvrB/UvrC motif-containing protein [Candidatus Paceibacterota bacterium]|nr:UvrB/UvrC motif-containing protein [Candidatus Paceibacterota bacterium]
MERTDLAKYDLPDEPGIYLFRKGRKILYVGKATSLHDRVRSYFSNDLIESRGPRIVGMVHEANSLTWETTNSVLEALILEANTIKRFQPPYNVDEKDNKSFNYLVITKEEFPRVLVVRGRELFQKWDDKNIKNLFGPFPQGGSLQEAIKIVRRIFPFRDSKCFPCGSPKNKLCKPCFNRQIGLCPGVCTGEMSKDEYRKVVRNICELFSGNFKGLKRTLAADMKAASQREDFEKAARLRRQIEALEHIRDVSLIKGDLVSSGGGVRIEAFDVAHTAGEETVAVMTVVDGGQPIKDAYRKFTIKTATNNDVASLKEALSRRLGHPEWPLPRVFVVDGAAAQLNVARRILRDAGVGVPIVGVVKNEYHRPKGLVGDQRAIEAYERDILLANNEAHRFAIGWHRSRRRKGALR